MFSDLFSEISSLFASWKGSTRVTGRREVKGVSSYMSIVASKMEASMLFCETFV